MEALIRLRALRTIGEQLLANRNGDLGFGKWDCGTYACLLGHYDRRSGMRPVAYSGYRGAADHFGISEREAEILFGLAKPRVLSPLNARANQPGPDAYAELERRMKRLNKIISRLERASTT